MEKNTPASISLWTGVGVIALLILMFCLGFIPLLNLLALLLFPVVLIGDGVAIVTGIMGIKRANVLNGLGKGAAMGGMIIGILHLLLLLFGFIMAILFGGLALLGGMLESLV
ncbi:MAG: hypothetical protein ABIO70_02390 [Pseudomonadota bacterium]